MRASIDTLHVRLGNLEERLEEIREAEEERAERRSSAAGEISRGSQVEESTIWSQISSVGSSVTVIDPEDRAGRERLAADIGRWIRRALAGEFRGSSGRDRLRLQNRLYLVFSDFEGVPLTPPLLVDRFSEVKRLCKRGSDCGRAVFVGVASKWEAEIIFREAGFTTHYPPSCKKWPVSLSKGGCSWGPGQLLGSTTNWCIWSLHQRKGSYL